MRDNILFDTNIICYAYDSAEPEKRAICESLLEDIWHGRSTAVVSNQILVELFNSLTRKRSVTKENALIITRALISSANWKKIEYNCTTVSKALDISKTFAVPFLDALIAETMKENDITEIITENEKDFYRIPGIKVTNPFKTEMK